MQFSFVVTLFFAKNLSFVRYLLGSLRQKNKKFENADNFSQSFNFKSAQIELKGDERKILYKIGGGRVH